MTVNEMQFGLMPEGRTIDAVFILRKIQQEYHSRKKVVCVCYEPRESFDRVWPMRKKGTLEALARSAMSFYKEAKRRVRVDSELSNELVVKVGMHQGSALSSFPFAVVVNVVTECARDGMLSELLYANYLVLMNVIIVGFKNKFLK